MHADIPFEVTEDTILGGRVRLTQPAQGYRAAIDPVLLAAMVPGQAGERALDLGCGVGAAALCLAVRVPGLAVTGLEIQPALAALARRNAEANGCSSRFGVEEGSAAAPPPPVALGGFDHVLTNPPYLEKGRGTPPPGQSKATANMEGEVDLAAWIRAASGLLKPKGRLTMIQRADRLGHILAAMQARGLGGITVVPLWPKPGRPAARVIVTARKGARTPLVLLPGLVLHRADGAYTDEAEAVLRHGAALLDPFGSAKDNG
ncbi:O-methyltransferase [Candidatus Terasakiella magnetica]|nr:O-methyltransferase [Candidatus Terasakiella magnetica]